MNGTAKRWLPHLTIIHVHDTGMAKFETLSKTSEPSSMSALLLLLFTLKPSKHVIKSKFHLCNQRDSTMLKWF